MGCLITLMVPVTLVGSAILVPLVRDRVIHGGGDLLLDEARPLCTFDTRAFVGGVLCYSIRSPFFHSVAVISRWTCILYGI